MTCDTLIMKAVTANATKHRVASFQSGKVVYEAAVSTKNVLKSDGRAESGRREKEG